MESKPTPTLLTVVAVALINRAGQVLMQQRPAGSEHGGLWEFPGGKVEPGEGPSAALVREIDEELGIAISAADLFPISFAGREPVTADPTQQNRPLVLLLYGCRRWQGTPVCEPGASLLWTLPDDVHALAMPPLDVPLAAALNAHEKTVVK